MFFSPNDLNSSETLINHRCAEVKNLNDSPKALTNIPNGEIARQTKRLKQNSKKTFKPDNVLGQRIPCCTNILGGFDEHTQTARHVVCCRQ